MFCTELVFLLLGTGSRHMGDAESRRNAKAEEEAWANVNRHQQKKFAVSIFVICVALQVHLVAL